jgi:hypothetical protein
MSEQIVKAEFSVIIDLRIEQYYLKDGEMCVKDKKDNKLYARKYRYFKPGECAIEDRPLNVIYHEEIIEGKKQKTLEYL